LPGVEFFDVSQRRSLHHISENVRNCEKLGTDFSEFLANAFRCTTYLKWSEILISSGTDKYLKSTILKTYLNWPEILKGSALIVQNFWPTPIAAPHI